MEPHGKLMKPKHSRIQCSGLVFWLDIHRYHVECNPETPEVIILVMAPAKPEVTVYCHFQRLRPGYFLLANQILFCTSEIIYSHVGCHIAHNEVSAPWWFRMMQSIQPMYCRTQNIHMYHIRSRSCITCRINSPNSCVARDCCITKATDLACADARSNT